MIGLAIFKIYKDARTGNLSRSWMEYAMDIVREKKPTPPEAARFYAIVSTVYYESLENDLKKGDNSDEASRATAEVINSIYPDKVSSTTEFLNRNKIAVVETNDFSKKLISEMIARIADDNSKTFEKKFVGSEYWTGEKPFSPSAGQWKRWGVQNIEFIVPPPPKYLSKEYMAALKEVKDKSDNRTTEQSALINFWGGVPGTETPSGIWQNRFYNTTKEYKMSDSDYAYKQMILAQALADSFMECWKVKYIYYTKRPNMVDQSINLAMKNPNFPSYVSGHSTISATAETILGKMFPEKKDLYLADALNAKNSRIWAGIHFPHDNDNGFKLGEDIGNYYVNNILK